MKGKMIVLMSVMASIAAVSFYFFGKDFCKTDSCKSNTTGLATCGSCGKTTCDKTCASNLIAKDGENKLMPSCSLDAAAQIKRGNEVIAKTFSKATVIKELPDGYDLIFPHSAELAAELNDIAQFERQCCASFTWEVVEEAAQKQVHLKVFGSQAVKKELMAGLGAAQLGLTHLFEKVEH